jgi:hypothetical protein
LNRRRSRAPACGWRDYKHRCFSLLHSSLLKYNFGGKT